MKIIRFHQVSNSFQSLRKIPEIKFGPIVALPVAVQSYTVTIGKVELRGERGRNRKTVVGGEKERRREKGNCLKWRKEARMYYRDWPLWYFIITGYGFDVLWLFEWSVLSGSWKGAHLFQRRKKKNRKLRLCEGCVTCVWVYVCNRKFATLTLKTQIISILI